jgi:xanthine/uracil permease
MEFDNDDEGGGYNHEPETLVAALMRMTPIQRKLLRYQVFIMTDEKPKRIAPALVLLAFITLIVYAIATNTPPGVVWAALIVGGLIAGYLILKFFKIL